MSHEHTTGKDQSDPVLVSRGRDLPNFHNLTLGFCGLDSLYLILEYPHADLYYMWADEVKHVSRSELRKGVPYKNYLIRPGAHSYPLSIWQGDARLYITDRVTENLRGTSEEGQGMGAMLQLGPMALRQCGDLVADRHFRECVRAYFTNFGVKHADLYPARINRADLTLDVVGLPIADINPEDWPDQWVGAAKPRAMYWASSTGMVEGFTVGSSSGTVAFRVYDKVFEAAHKGALDFWRSVWGLSDDQFPPVTRFEWAVKCFQGDFTGLSYLKDLSFEGFLSLLNYVTLKWGRLCIPNPDDTNQTRWALAPLWVALRQLIDEWSLGYDTVAKREYVYTPDLNGEYLAQLVGWLSGFMARAAIKRGDGEPLKPEQVILVLDELGYSGEELSDKAAEKYARLSKLAGGAR